METVVKFIYDYGLLAMFLIIMLEYACFPVSSEIVLPFSGAVASAKDIPFAAILAASIAAGLIGTGICYLIGRAGGPALLTKITRRFPRAGKGLKASNEKFLRMGKPAVCIGRIIPICRTYIAFIAGAAGQAPSVFFPYSFLGIAVWNTLLLGIGYALRENWSVVGIYYARYKSVLIPLLLFIIFVFVFLKHRRSNSKNITH